MGYPCLVLSSLVQHTDVGELQVPLGFALALWVSEPICTPRMNGRCRYLSWERGWLPRCWTSGWKAKTRCFPPAALIIKSTQELYRSSSVGRWVTARVSSFFSRGENQPVGGERVEGILYCRGLIIG